WDTRRAKLLSVFRDNRVAVGPIGLQFHNSVPLECFPDSGALEHAFLVELTGQTPGRGKIYENGVALITLALQTLGGKLLPVAARHHLRDVDLRRLKLVADEINGA